MTNQLNMGKSPSCETPNSGFKKPTYSGMASKPAPATISGATSMSGGK